MNETPDTPTASQSSRKRTVDDLLASAGSENLKVALSLLEDALKLVDSLAGTPYAEFDAKSMRIGWHAKRSAAKDVNVDYEASFLVTAKWWLISAHHSLFKAEAYQAHEAVLSSPLVGFLKSAPGFFKDALESSETGLESLDNRFNSVDDLVTRVQLHWVAASSALGIGDRPKAVYHLASICRIAPSTQTSLEAKKTLAQIGADPNAAPEEARAAVSRGSDVRHSGPSQLSGSKGVGDTEYTVAWVCIVLGFCFFPTMLLGLWAAHIAVKKGREDAKIPRAIALVVSGLGILGIVFAVLSSVF